MTHDCGETKRYDQLQKDYFAGRGQSGVLHSGLRQTKLTIALIIIVHPRATYWTRIGHATATRLPPISCTVLVHRASRGKAVPS